MRDPFKGDDIPFSLRCENISQFCNWPKWLSVKVSEEVKGIRNQIDFCETLKSEQHRSINSTYRLILSFKNSTKKPNGVEIEKLIKEVQRCASFLDESTRILTQQDGSVIRQAGRLFEEINDFSSYRNIPVFERENSHSRSDSRKETVTYFALIYVHMKFSQPEFFSKLESGNVSPEFKSRYKGTVEYIDDQVSYLVKEMRHIRQLVGQNVDAADIEREGLLRYSAKNSSESHVGRNIFEEYCRATLTEESAMIAANGFTENVENALGALHKDSLRASLIYSNSRSLRELENIHHQMKKIKSKPSNQSILNALSHLSSELSVALPRTRKEDKVFGDVKEQLDQIEAAFKEGRNLRRISVEISASEPTQDPAFSKPVWKFPAPKREKPGRQRGGPRWINPLGGLRGSIHDR